MKEEIKSVEPELDRLKDLGFNIVRLLISWKAIEPRPNTNLDELLPEGKQYLTCIKEIIDKTLIYKNRVSFNILVQLKFKIFDVISTYQGDFIFIPKNNNEIEKKIRRNDVNMFMRDYSKLIKQLNKLFKQHNLCNNVIKYIWNQTE